MMPLNLLSNTIFINRKKNQCKMLLKSNELLKHLTVICSTGSTSNNTCQTREYKRLLYKTEIP